MAKLQVEKFALELEKCFKDFQDAIQDAFKIYKETTGTVESMDKEEEKAFLKEAFLFLYKKADDQFNLSDMTDASAMIAIPLCVEQLFKIQEKLDKKQV